MAHDHACPHILATLVRSARRRLHLTQQEVATKAAVHPSYISKIERQHRAAPGMKLLRVGQVLDIPAATLMQAILTGCTPPSDHDS